MFIGYASLLIHLKENIIQKEVGWFFVFCFFTFFIMFRNKNIIHCNIGCFLREEVHIKVIPFDKSRKNSTLTEI